MGFFDFFKGKKKKSSDDDALYFALQKAMKNPEHREAFYDCLLTSELFIRTGKTNSQYMTFNDGTLPVFSSPQRMLDDASLDGFPAYTRVMAKDLFAAHPGSTFWLDPFSEYNKQLIPDEISYIMAEPAEPSTLIQPQEEQSMLIGIPKDVPEAMVNSLKEHFRSQPSVSAAYLNLILIEGEEQTHYLVSIMTNGEMSDEDFGKLLPQNFTRFIEPGTYVDFRPVAPGDVDEENSILFYGQAR